MMLMTAPHSHGAASVLIATVVLLLGCTEPALQEPDPAGEGARDDAATETDPGNRELAAAIDAMRATVASARDELAKEEVSHTDAQSALGLLLDERGETGQDHPPLLPAVSPERGESTNQDDVFTTVLTLARDAGGEFGERTVAALRDGVAGDLGAWERDAAGVVDSIESTIAGPPRLEQLEQDILDLPGDATRALAWVLLAADTDDDEARGTYADRAVAHLDIVLGILERLTTEPEPEADPETERDTEEDV